MKAYLNESIDLALHLLVGIFVIWVSAAICVGIGWCIWRALQRIFDHISFRK